MIDTCIRLNLLKIVIQIKKMNNSWNLIQIINIDKIHFNFVYKFQLQLKLPRNREIRLIRN